MVDTGWVIAGTGANVTGIGTEAWSSPGNVTADDASGASGAAAAKDEQMNYLRGSNFGLSVPTGATIDGIEMRFQCFDNNTQSVINDARLYHPSAGNATDQEAGESSVFGQSWVDYDYGGATELHGETWTAANVNDSTFGAMMSVDVNGALGVGGDPLCDAIWIKVYYTEAAASGRSYGMVIG